MPNLLSRLKSSALTASLLASAALLPTATYAGDVILKSADGGVDLAGELVDFTGDAYLVNTALGELRVPAARVTCEGAGCPTLDVDSADIKFAGSDAIGTGLMPLLLSGYAANMDAKVDVTKAPQGEQMLAALVGDSGFGDDLGSYLVTPTSTEDAFDALLAGEAQIGMASRRITPDEARALKATGAGNMISASQEHILAVDNMVIVTHPSNPVSSITLDQLRDVYAGLITNWAELGGEDLPIQIISRAKDTGARASFEASIFGRAIVSSTPSELIAQSNKDMADMVNENTAAIGFVPYAFQRGAKPMNLVSACGIVHEPDMFSAKTEEYPLQRRLYLYNRADLNSGMAEDFLDYALSEDADTVIAKAGFIDLGVTRRHQSMEGQRARMLLDPEADAYEANVMRNMLDAMIGYDRLSTTIRFRTGSFLLDERSIVDMERLVDYLKDQPGGTKITLVGFTDSVGAFDSNQELSEKRAQSFAGALRETGGSLINHIEISTAGFGELAPTSCNDSEESQSINRRVEVWIEAGAQG